MYSSKLSSRRWSSPLCCAAAATVSTRPAVAPSSPHSASHRSDQAGRGILRPRVVHDDRRAAQLPQPPCHAGAEERALADAARPVEDGEPVREHVRRHRRDLALAAEEEERVELGVLERSEALVRALRDAAHETAAFSSARSSSATYAAGAMSTTSTSRRRQNSRSSGCGPGCTDQERYGSGSLPQKRSRTTRSVQVESV